MSALALCDGCGGHTFEVVVNDRDEAVICADCRMVRICVPTWEVWRQQGADWDKIAEHPDFRMPTRPNMVTIR